MGSTAAIRFSLFQSGAVEQAKLLAVKAMDYSQQALAPGGSKFEPPKKPGRGRPRNPPKTILTGLRLPNKVGRPRRIRKAIGRPRKYDEVDKREFIEHIDARKSEALREGRKLSDAGALREDMLEYYRDFCLGRGDSTEKAVRTARGQANGKPFRTLKVMLSRLRSREKKNSAN